MTRNQHFVPQFLLRNWSNDKKSINLFLKKDSSVVNNAPIKGQSQKDYFYGKDQKVESFLASIETEASIAINKLLTEENADEINFDEKLKLDAFFTIQRIRTPNSRLQTKEVLSKFMQSIFDKMPKYPNMCDKFNSTPISEENPSSWFFQEFFMTFYLYCDLKIVLLKSSECEFVIGQDPLVVINPFLSEIKWPYSHAGLAQKGFMAILPISPKYAICLYDRSVYRFKQSKKVVQLCSDDVDLLNCYQYLKSESCVYFQTFFSKLQDYNETTRGKKTVRSISISNLEIKDSEYLTYQKIEEYDFRQDFCFVGILCDALNKKYDRNSMIRVGVKEMWNLIDNNPSLKKIFGPFI